MRIITGTKRGKKLLALEGEQVRPTTNMVKEALFNILQFGIEGRRFLDLFAGSGQIGLEALSRGAREAVLVDSSRDSVRVIQKNVEAAGFAGQARVAQSDFASYLRGERGRFDVAFLDPPYEAGLLGQALELAAGVMAPGGVMVCEHGSKETPPTEAGGFALKKTHRYGRTALTVYRAKETAEGAEE
jgi:16S rRNA (guanine966-N2)-methyltransferase